MTHWKPDKPGIYRLDGRDCGVVQEFGGDFEESGDSRTKWKSLRLTMPDGPWSLTGPDWQPGAPTVAQLERWKWWAVEAEGGMLAGPVVRTEFHLTMVGNIAFYHKWVTRSAPIQEDMSNGLLYVPREVAE